MLSSSIANAAFIGENVPGFGNGSVDESISGQVTIYSSNTDQPDELPSSFLYTDIASSDIKVSFNWFYQTFDEDGSFDQFNGIYFDPVGFIINGVKTQLNSEVIPQFSAESGTSYFSVSAGSTFGFYADTADNSAGSGALTISNLLITPVPEPDIYCMLMLGFGLLLVAQRNRT